MIDEALNDFKLTGGTLFKSAQMAHNNSKKEVKDVGKSLNKTGQVGLKNQTTILGSIGL